MSRSRSVGQARKIALTGLGRSKTHTVEGIMHSFRRLNHVQKLINSANIRVVHMLERRGIDGRDGVQRRRELSKEAENEVASLKKESR